ncbi:IS4 family transposase [Desulfatitalea alkaliphila]|uniref:IS4 family transposase n=1 Tax=Desulfatitalea alkaliphila TaxID=2929485 RepID=A0AA41USE6_9BACT|nr:IS4 family transposase [Desulfatitalea alkaliphila]MCJ8503203.1 IS4 family transposase [Desulfatitalea alkaliphila]
MVYSLSTITANYRNERSTPCRKFFQILSMLARNLNCHNCAKIFRFLKKIISSKEFIDRNRTSSTAFTRRRKLPFKTLIIFLINFVRGSYQDELDKFFKSVFRLDVATRVVTKAALTKARAKLKFDAFIELNGHLISYFEKHLSPRTWLGFRLLAIDGSTTRLPIYDDIIEHFGTWKGRKGAPSPMARISQLFDPLNKITIDAAIGPKSVGERKLAAENHFLKLMPNDLLLLDRGYPAWWLFRLVLSQQADFCARISCTKWKAVRKFFHSGKSEKIVDLAINASSKKPCAQWGLDIAPLKVRLVRIERDGKVQVLITSLLDRDLYPIEIFYDLYHCRWPVEEDYKAVKSRMELENFSGQSALSVHQDFHAKIFYKNLVSILAIPARRAIEMDTGTCKYIYQINFTYALSQCKGVIPLMFYKTHSRVKRMVADLCELFQRTVEPIRPGRTYPRTHKVKPRKFFPQYKPIG